jgi:hypothetical protein
MWKLFGMITGRGKLKWVETIWPQSCFIHHRSYMICPGIESRILWGEAGNTPLVL